MNRKAWLSPWLNIGFAVLGLFLLTGIASITLVGHLFAPSQLRHVDPRWQDGVVLALMLGAGFGIYPGQLLVRLLRDPNAWDNVFPPISLLPLWCHPMSRRRTFYGWLSIGLMAVVTNGIGIVLWQKGAENPFGRSGLLFFSAVFGYGLTSSIVPIISFCFRGGKPPLPDRPAKRPSIPPLDLGGFFHRSWLLVQGILYPAFLLSLVFLFKMLSDAPFRHRITNPLFSLSIGGMFLIGVFTGAFCGRIILDFLRRYGEEYEKRFLVTFWSFADRVEGKQVALSATGLKGVGFLSVLLSSQVRG